MRSVSWKVGGLTGPFLVFAGGEDRSNSRRRGMVLSLSALLVENPSVDGIVYVPYHRRRIEHRTGGLVKLQHGRVPRKRVADHSIPRGRHPANNVTFKSSPRSTVRSIYLQNRTTGVTSSGRLIEVLGNCQSSARPITRTGLTKGPQFRCSSSSFSICPSPTTPDRRQSGSTRAVDSLGADGLSRRKVIGSGTSIIRRPLLAGWPPVFWILCNSRCSQSEPYRLR